MAAIIDGKKVAEEVLAECSREIEDLKSNGITPGLAVVLVGEDPASQVYVNSKFGSVLSWEFIQKKLSFQKALLRMRFWPP